MHVFREFAETFDVFASMFTAWQLNLGEKGLAGFALAPIGSVVHRFIPFEVVVGFAHRRARFVGPTGDCCVVASFLKKLGDWAHAFG